MSINLDSVAIYILELEENKYYIGRSKKKTDAGIHNRIKQHFNQQVGLLRLGVKNINQLKL